MQTGFGGSALGELRHVFLRPPCLWLNFSSRSPRRVAAPNIAVSQLPLEALRYAVEDKLAHTRAVGVWLQVGDERFDSVEIQRLYEDGEYPFRKSTKRRASAIDIGSPFTGKAQDFDPRPRISKSR